MTPRRHDTGVVCRVCDVPVKTGDCIVSLPVYKANLDQTGQFTTQGTLLQPTVVHSGCFDRVCALAKIEG